MYFSSFLSSIFGMQNLHLLRVHLHPVHTFFNLRSFERLYLLGC
nr:MAG TPA: hypothetical protein [Caudoviricetes sp.]